jgi:hypothetical protein
MANSKFLYSHSENKFKRWIHTNGNKSPQRIMERFCQDELTIYDADVCGEDVYSFAFLDEKIKQLSYYDITHEWYVNYDPDFEVVNDFIYERVDKPTIPITSNRDWLIVSTY